MTILVDTSALVEYLRGTAGDAGIRVRALAELFGELAITDVVAMEVLSGARDDAHLARLEEFLGGFEFLATERPDDYELAAALYRDCRSSGITIRQLMDCVIAAVAIRNDVPILHDDRDFDQLARHTPLQIA